MELSSVAGGSAQLTVEHSLPLSLSHSLPSPSSPSPSARESSSCSAAQCKWRATLRTVLVSGQSGLPLATSENAHKGDRRQALTGAPVPSCSRLWEGVQTLARFGHFLFRRNLRYRLAAGGWVGRAGHRATPLGAACRPYVCSLDVLCRSSLADPRLRACCRDHGQVGLALPTAPPFVLPAIFPVGRGAQCLSLSSRFKLIRQCTLPFAICVQFASHLFGGGRLRRE